MKNFRLTKRWFLEHRSWLKECDVVPTGRHVVATGASPWTGKMSDDESRRDDMNAAAQTHVVPLGLKTLFANGSTGSRPWLQPVATPWLKHNLKTDGLALTEAAFFQREILHGVASQGEKVTDRPVEEVGPGI